MSWWNQRLAENIGLVSVYGNDSGTLRQEKK